MKKTKSQLLEEIGKDQRLFEFACKVLSYKRTLKSDIRYLFLVTLISSDNLWSVEDCEKSLETLNFIKKNIDLIYHDDLDRKEILKYVNKGLRIIKRDMKKFKQLKETHDNEQKK